MPAGIHEFHDDYFSQVQNQSTETKKIEASTFKMLLGCPRPILGHCQSTNLAPYMLITVSLWIFFKIDF